MAFSLNSPTGIASAAGFASRQKLAMRTGGEPGESAKKPVTSAEPARETGKTALQNSIEGLARTSAEALSAVKNVRSEQAALVERMSEISEGPEFNRLKQEYDNLQTEISRISESATYNGRNALEGGVFDLNGSGKTTSLADTTGLTEPPDVSLATPEDASDAYQVLVSALSSTSQAAASAEASAASASAPAQESVTLSPAASSDPSAEQATSLALEIAQQIKGKFGGAPDSDANLVSSLLSHSLERDRVRDLLND